MNKKNHAYTDKSNKTVYPVYQVQPKKAPYEMEVFILPKEINSMSVSLT